MKAKLLKDYDLTGQNTFRVSAQASYFAEANSIEALQELIKVINSKDELARLPKYILGGGSNTLFVGNYKGIVLKLDIAEQKVLQEDQHSVLLQVGAGEDWPTLVDETVSRGWGGFENLSLIPGHTGAAPVQNIGAYGVELDQYLDSLVAVDLETGAQIKLQRQACGFGYRSSNFKSIWKGKYAIAYVNFRLRKKGAHKLELSYDAVEDALKASAQEPYTISDVAKVIKKIRTQKLPDPRKVGTAGSFFKNPIVSAAKLSELQQIYDFVPNYPGGESGKVKLAAGWLIDQAGWKGKTINSGKAKYGVHPQHALVLVNYHGASGQQVWQLAQEIQADVQSKTGIRLEPEVNIVGAN